jgi:hypothetical protein
VKLPETTVAPPPTAISGDGCFSERTERDEFRERRKFGKMI